MSRYHFLWLRKEGKVAIVGSGLIGSCWATLFVSAGYSVCLYDISEAQLDLAKKTVLHKLEQLQNEGLSRGTTTVEEAEGRISTTVELSEALSGAFYAQVYFW
ncbi:3-hydroxyacyl-CoA dehydrogenase, NAD binding domain protein [Cooperia oncophora]